jgi:hypothetical protein
MVFMASWGILMGAEGAGGSSFSGATEGETREADTFPIVGGRGLPQEAAKKRVRDAAEKAMKYRRIIYRFYSDLW